MAPSRAVHCNVWLWKRADDRTERAADNDSNFQAENDLSQLFLCESS